MTVKHSILLFFVIYNQVMCMKKLIGDVHTSAAYISPLVLLEHRITEKLKFLAEDETMSQNLLTKYIDDWNQTRNDDYSSNPMNSFHFFKRLVEEFEAIENVARTGNSSRSSAVFESIHSMKNSIMQPTKEDINGAAWAIVRLQEVYDLKLDDLIEGKISNSKAIKGLSAKDCLLMGKQSFDNLAFDLSEMWTKKGISLLRRKNPMTKEDYSTIKEAEIIISKRKMIRELVTTMASKNSKNLHGKFSGLGVPKSFEKIIYDNHLKGDQVGQLEEVYRILCRGEKVDTTIPDEPQTCHFSWGKSKVSVLKPFKVEKVLTHPRMTMYHDVISDKEIQLLQEISFSQLKTARVKPYSNKEIMQSIARIGKSAWLKKGSHPLIETLFKRIEVMTGMSTRYAEELHVLNYGVGGQYDLHIDFFDFMNRSPNVYETKDFRGDQIATILFYLNDVDEGGLTVFPFINTGVKPRKGSVIVWYNLHRNGSGNYKTLHGSCPVLLGQKWISTLWLSEIGQELCEPCSLNPKE